MENGEKNGIVVLASSRSVQEIVDRLIEALRAKAIKLFASIDHSGEANAAGLRMPPTKLLIFGNPKAGTPLMLAAPTAALDLPLKILVWEDAEGKVWVAYNSASYLQARHGFPEDLMQNIAATEGLAASVAAPFDGSRRP